MRGVIYLIIFFLFVSCKKENSQENEGLKISSFNCNFSKFLNNEKIPIVAKELFYNRYKYDVKGENELMFIPSKINEGDFVEKAFYFRVITNSYKISDGIYSEELGFQGKKYVENNTTEFISFFDYKDCFNDKDLETWADICMLEIYLEFDETEKDYNKPLNNFHKILNERTKNLTNNQKITLNKFYKFLDEKWYEFLINTD